MRKETDAVGHAVLALYHYAAADVYISGSTGSKPNYLAVFLRCPTTLDGGAMVCKDKGAGIYQEVGSNEFESYKTQLIPYYAWSNRGNGEMTVFMPVIRN